MKKLITIIMIITSMMLVSTVFADDYIKSRPKSTKSILGIPTGTVAQRDSGTTPQTGDTYYVTDGVNTGDCITGSGSEKVLCVYNGSTWINQGNTNGVDFVITCTDGDIVGVSDCGGDYDLRNGFIVEITSGTVTLPAVTLGYVSCVKATTAATININPNDSDRFILDGTALDDGDQLTSAGALDDTICFYADSIDGWTTFFNPKGFTDGN